MGNCFSINKKRKSIDPSNEDYSSDEEQLLFDEDEILKQIKLHDLELHSNVELRNYVHILYKQNEDLLKELAQLSQENTRIDSRRETIENQVKFFIDNDN